MKENFRVYNSKTYTTNVRYQIWINMKVEKQNFVEKS